MRQSDKTSNFKMINVTGQSFLNYSSTEGAPSDCSVEACPGHSEAIEDIDHEVEPHHLSEVRRTVLAILPRELNLDRSR